MTELAKTPSGANAPYKHVKEGGKWVVKNNAGEVKARFPGTPEGEAKAVTYLRALYASVNGAGKRAAKTPFTGNAKNRVKSAEEFFFEHTWVPVPGHPEEVATCDLCGLNRWSDDHQVAADAPAKPYGDVAYADPGYRDGKKRYPIDTADHVRSAWAYINQSGNAKLYSPAQREKIKSRIASAAKKFGIDLAAEKAALLERLTKQYGRVDAVAAKPPTDLPPMPPLGPSDKGLPPREVEDRTIAENAKTPAAQGPHPFMEAQFPDEDGDPRCLLCGADNPAHKVFEPEVPVAAAEDSAVRAPLTATPVLQEGQRLPEVESSKAFLTEVNGRTLITAPANVFTTETEKALHANENFLWMQGRFVGAEKANRNGAFWKTEDLELGELTVRHGPLNWLHEAKHVIGTIADTRMVTRDEQTASDLEQPHISALSAIWKWIYPDEAWVVEQASDAGKLWYSMECVSKEVACVGDNGCGATASYGDYLKGQGGTCAHMTERSATRHFANPTFLGGAVIVPPVRPGWAEADATVLRQASSMAEVSYEQACPANTTASEWEQLMAQLVRYAGR